MAQEQQFADPSPKVLNSFSLKYIGGREHKNILPLQMLPLPPHKNGQISSEVPSCHSERAYANEGPSLAHCLISLLNFALL